MLEKMYVACSLVLVIPSLLWRVEYQHPGLRLQQYRVSGEVAFHDTEHTMLMDHALIGSSLQAVPETPG